ncbi:hypothetical protein OSB04_017334, partial [Centaurea solstitialis]
MVTPGICPHCGEHFTGDVLFDHTMSCPRKVPRDWIVVTSSDEASTSSSTPKLILEPAQVASSDASTSASVLDLLQFLNPEYFAFRPLVSSWQASTSATIPDVVQSPASLATTETSTDLVSSYAPVASTETSADLVSSSATASEGLFPFTSNAATSISHLHRRRSQPAVSHFHCRLSPPPATPVVDHLQTLSIEAFRPSPIIHAARHRPYRNISMTPPTINHSVHYLRLTTNEVSSNPTLESANVTDPESTQMTKEKRKDKREKPDMWDHFTRDPNDETYSACDYCTQSKNGTTSLRNHLARCKKYPYNMDKKQKLLIFQSQSSVQDSGDSNSTFTTWKFDQSMCRKYLARMIILDEKPFMTVEQEGFHDFVNMLQPQFQIPSRITVARDCFDIYTAEKESLKKYFRKTKQRVCLTTDLWSSRQNLTVSGHSGEILGKYIENSLIDWGIDKVLTVTVDNTSSNHLAVRYLKRRLNTWKNSVLDSEHLHMRCCAHILSLVVKEGLKEVDDSIYRIRSAVKYTRSSPARLQRFRECVEKVKVATKGLVCLDVETRWNLTYLMLESAIKFEMAFDMLEEQDNKYKSKLLSSKGVPIEEDWTYTKSLLPFLRGFYNSILRIFGSLYVTSNMYFHEVFGLGAMIRKKMQDEDESLRKMAEKMKKKYHKYWSNMENINIYLFIGPILDPRHKLGPTLLRELHSPIQIATVVYCDNVIAVYMSSNPHVEIDIHFVRDKVANGQIRVLHVPSQFQYADIFTKGLPSALFFDFRSSLSVRSPPAQTAGAKREILNSDNDDPAAFLNNQYKRQLEESSGFTGAKTEKDRYLDEQCEPLHSKFEILAWWKKNKARFPVMAAMARDILAISASTVASKSAFSTEGRVLNAFRSPLTPRLVEALICSQNLLRSKGFPINIEEKLEELEALEADLKDLPEALSSIAVD